MKASDIVRHLYWHETCTAMCYLYHLYIGTRSSFSHLHRRESARQCALSITHTAELLATGHYMYCFMPSSSLATQRVQAATILSAYISMYPHGLPANYTRAAICRSQRIWHLVVLGTALCTW